MSSVALKVLSQLFKYRRISSDAQNSDVTYLSSHLEKLDFFIRNQEPIHLILPAFPAKSPNPQKVLGKLPDMAERISLKFLQYLCSQIQDIYPPGAKLTICSDGRVFSDIVSVSDEDVTAYGNGIEEIIHEIGADSLDTFSMESIFTEMSFSEMRAKLSQEYANSIDNIVNLVKTDHNHCNLFNGMHRFLCEDYQVLQPHKSRNKVRNECKELTYHLIQRSNAWSSLIAEKFSNSLRLSIHPYGEDSEKIGIHMIKTKDSWGTPWHNVAVYDGSNYCLMKRSVAEQNNAHLIKRNGRPSHYLLPNTQTAEKKEESQKVAI